MKVSNKNYKTMAINNIYNVKNANICNKYIPNTNITTCWYWGTFFLQYTFRNRMNEYLVKVTNKNIF